MLRIVIVDSKFQDIPACHLYLPPEQKRRVVVFDSEGRHCCLAVTKIPVLEGNALLIDGNARLRIVSNVVREGWIS